MEYDESAGESSSSETTDVTDSSSSFGETGNSELYDATDSAQVGASDELMDSQSSDADNELFNDDELSSTETGDDELYESGDSAPVSASDELMDSQSSDADNDLFEGSSSAETDSTDEETTKSASTDTDLVKNESTSGEENDPGINESIEESSEQNLNNDEDGTDWSRTSLSPEEEAELRALENEGAVNKTIEVQAEWEEPEKPTEHLPTEKTGVFLGDRGNSDFVPNNEKAQKRMADFGRDSVTYKKGSPDFSPFAKHKFGNSEIDTTVEIPHMTGDRKNPPWEGGRRPRGTSHDKHYDIGNFAQADNALLKMLKDSGFESATLKDVKKFKADNNLVWHELDDGKTMQLVPREIHDACPHSGGVSEQKYRGEYGGIEKPNI